MKCVAVSFWVWYWSKKVKWENKPCNLHLGILHVSIWIWVLPKVDPVTRNWFQEVYLGDGMMERGERHRKERRANKRCDHGQVTAVGNWGSVLLGMLWETVQITLHIPPTPQGGRCCRATNSCPFLLEGCSWGISFQVSACRSPLGSAKPGYGESMAHATVRKYDSSDLENIESSYGPL